VEGWHQIELGRAGPQLSSFRLHDEFRNVLHAYYYYIIIIEECVIKKHAFRGSDSWMGFESAVPESSFQYHNEASL
jgi:hypothetical protein